MPTLPISGLPAATLPLGDTDALAVVQGGTTKKAPKSAFAGAAAALVLLATRTANGSATTLDFTSVIVSTYDDYVFEILNIVPSATGENLRVRVSTDNGATWDAANYRWSNITDPSGTIANDGSSGTGYINLNDANGGISNSGAMGIVGSIRCKSPQNASVYTTFYGQTQHFGYTGTYFNYLVSGIHTLAAAINAVRFYTTSANLAAGIIRCYGIAKV